MLRRHFLVVFLILFAGLCAAENTPIRAWQQRIEVDIPLPVPAVSLQAANPFASNVDVVPRIVQAVPPKNVPVSGRAVVAAHIDGDGKCAGSVPLELPFPGLSRVVLAGVQEGRYESARSGDRERSAWAVIEVLIEGKIKEARVVSSDLALPDPGDPPEPKRGAATKPTGRLLQLPSADPSELSSRASVVRLRVRAPSAESEVSVQALVHVDAAGRCDRFVPLVLDSGLERWLSGFLASWRLEPATLQGTPVDTWVVYTARLRMDFSTLKSKNSRVFTSRDFDPAAAE